MDNKILFLHGFTSGGNCTIASELKSALSGEAEVVSPDLPLHPAEALQMVESLCASGDFNLVIGSSCGAFFAQQAVQQSETRAILVNPFFMMSEFLTPRVGEHQYKCKREDGQQTFVIDEGLIDEYREMEQHQFDGYREEMRYRVLGLFGLHDHLAHFRTLFLKYYSTCSTFNGGHTMEPENVRRVLAPIAIKMINDK